MSLMHLPASPAFHAPMRSLGRLLPLWLLVLVSASTACLDGPRVCASGLVCPSGSECAAAQDTCISTACGNGIVDRGEQCDDGNLEPGDGCSPACCGELAAGGQHTCAIADGGQRAQCWGQGMDGQLGRSIRVIIGDDEPAGSDSVYLGPEDVVVDLAAGNVHTCVLLEGGRVRCWGSNEYGILGYGSSLPRDNANLGDDETPANAGYLELGGPVIQLAAGGVHTCALMDRHKVRCWGWDGYGQLGYALPGDQEIVGDNEDAGAYEDVEVSADSTVTVTQVASGSNHTCALLSSGEVRCWGLGRYGQLGYANTGNVGNDQVPADMPPVRVGGTVVQLTAGWEHTCALLDTGRVRCWGRSKYGQLGYANDDRIGDNEHPEDAGDVAIGGPVTQVVAGGFHTCALLDGGQVRCWGRNDRGQLGYGPTALWNIGFDRAPKDAGDVPVGGTVIQLVAGLLHTCALMEDRQVRCWGAGEQVGYGQGGNIGDDEEPQNLPPLPLGGPVVKLAAGGQHTCALLEGGQVHCWGLGRYGQLGYGTLDTVGDGEPARLLPGIDLGGSLTQIVAGSRHTCALQATGAVHCWGAGADGRLGYGKTRAVGASEPPIKAGTVQVGLPVTQLAAGDAHTCALTDQGTIRCWGLGTSGQLGYATTDSIGDNEPPDVAGDILLGGRAAQVVAGAHHTCALLRSGTVRCWGASGDGRLGYGVGAGAPNLGDTEHPVEVGDVPVGSPVTQLTAGGQHTCALLDTGDIRCWGSNAHGQLGYPGSEPIGDSETPASKEPIALGAPAIRITAGEHHTCALLATGAVHCWGRNDYGQLGRGNATPAADRVATSNDPRPREVELGGPAVALAAGGQHTCAFLRGGGVRCWGLGTSGQLGYGNPRSVGDDETPAMAGDVPR